MTAEGSSHSSIRIRQGENFYCQSFGELWVPEELAPGVEIAPGVWAGRGLPVIPGGHWEKWLGEIAFSEIRTSFVLTATAPQPKPGSFVNQKLSDKIKHLTLSLLLQGVPHFRQSFLIAGANDTVEADARQFQRARVFYPSRGSEPLSVGRPELERALLLAAGLESIDNKGEDWRRLRRSIDALARGSAEPYLQDERLHQFVRSLEGLILPKKAHTEKQFIHRSKTFAIANAKTEEALRQIFNIRSKVEHLHNPLDALEGEEREELLYRRTRQVERLARSAISRVLENQSLREIFRTDASIDAFWTKKDHERIELWGSRLDLDAIN